MGAVGKHPDEPTFVRSSEFRNTLVVAAVVCFVFGFGQSIRKVHYPTVDEVRGRIKATQLEVELAKAKAELRQVEREIELAENPPEIKAELEFEEVVVPSRLLPWTALAQSLLVIFLTTFAFVVGRRWEQLS